MTEQRVAIVAGARTPFVKAGKAFASLGPLALARHAVGGLLARHEVDPSGIEAIAFGVVVPEKGKPNLAREIVLETVPLEGVEHDTGPRPDTSLEKLATLAPAFDPDGTITAGNASPVTAS